VPHKLFPVRSYARNGAKNRGKTLIFDKICYIFGNFQAFRGMLYMFNIQLFMSNPMVPKLARPGTPSKKYSYFTDICYRVGKKNGLFYYGLRKSQKTFSLIFYVFLGHGDAFLIIFRKKIFFKIFDFLPWSPLMVKIEKNFFSNFLKKTIYPPYFLCE